jgi:glycine/D-amino acid oxidase-like deaminating enzyme
LRVLSGQTDDPPYVPALPHGFEGQPTGADLLLDPTLIHEHFPFLTESVVAALHTRRCGKLSAQQLGMYLLERAREHGARLLCARVDSVDASGGRVQAVHISNEAGTQTIGTNILVNAAGPFVRQVGQMVDVDLPVVCELHTKIAFKDSRDVIPHTAPLYYWADPQTLPWSEDDRTLLAESEETRWLLEPFPSGPHGVPEGGAGSQTQLVLWTYDVEIMEPVVPLPPLDPHYFEVVLRGLSRMIPGLIAYFDRLPRPVVDGGYYAKTRENRPLIGPLPVTGAYVIGALSGFGIMAACAAGELLAAHVAGSELPAYAPWFLLERYDDPEYCDLLETWDASGQL